MSRGLLIIISGPSGAGKGTVYNKVLERMPKIRKSVSVTTRLPRQGEVEGVHYYFKNIEEYQQMIANGEFLETASVYSNYYGTPKAQVMQMLERGEDVMFEIDIHGAKQIQKRYAHCVSIFLMPPSFADLEKRLRERKTDSEDSIQHRLGSAESELAKYEIFDYIVFNDAVENAVDKIVNIINAEKCKIAYNTEIINSLLNERKSK
ncbi:guanylate kinase-related [Holotrichia oblita]|nr:guanylate kinase-related [Holotrichia oblita]